MLNGYHLMLGGTLAQLPTVEQLLDTLGRLVSATGLTPISPPIASVRGEDYSAFVMIAESHISLHGKGQMAVVDVFSCRAFDHDGMKQHLEDQLGGVWQEQAFMWRSGFANG